MYSSFDGKVKNSLLCNPNPSVDDFLDFFFFFRFDDRHYKVNVNGWSFSGGLKCTFNCKNILMF